MKSNDKLVTVITVCFNPGKDLEPTISSVLGQSLQNIEYVIVDGGSTDGSVQKIEALAKLDSRITWKSEKDNGIYDAMNKGIEMATGKWLNFMNAGDAFANSMVLEKMNFSKYKDDGIIYGNITKDYQTVVYPKTVDLLKYGKIMACHQAMFFNKSILKEQMKYDSKLILNGDSELVTRIHHLGYKIRYVNNLIAYYKGGGASNNFIFKSKMQKYNRIWNYYGFIGVFRAFKMQLNLIKADEFSVKSSNSNSK